MFSQSECFVPNGKNNVEKKSSTTYDTSKCHAWRGHAAKSLSSLGGELNWDGMVAMSTPPWCGCGHRTASPPSTCPQKSQEATEQQWAGVDHVWTRTQKPGALTSLIASFYLTVNLILACRSFCMALLQLPMGYAESSSAVSEKIKWKNIRVWFSPKFWLLSSVGHLKRLECKQEFVLSFKIFHLMNHGTLHQKPMMYCMVTNIYNNNFKKN